MLGTVASSQSAFFCCKLIPSAIQLVNHFQSSCLGAFVRCQHLLHRTRITNTSPRHGLTSCARLQGLASEPPSHPSSRPSLQRPRCSSFRQLSIRDWECLWRQVCQQRHPRSYHNLGRRRKSWLPIRTFTRLLGCSRKVCFQGQTHARDGSHLLTTLLTLFHSPPASDRPFESPEKPNFWVVSY